MQILEIVLYSKDGKKRTLPFNTGKVNIITGGSGTGKSALIDIVEYCLGRDSCMVPDGIIREKVEWYGLRLKFDTDEIFIARANPPLGQNTTNSAYFEQGEVVNSPVKINTSNTDNATIVDIISRKMGISPNLHVPKQNQTRDPLEANVKHALFLCLQQQDEIASKRTLFHRQAENFIGQSQKDTLPYFLGAVQEDNLMLQQELARAKRELKIAKRNLQENEIIKGEDLKKATSLLAEAYQVGLFEKDDFPSEFEKQVELLKNITEWDPVIPYEPVIDDINRVQTKLYNLNLKLKELSETIRVAKKFARESDGYGSELFQQHLRLSSINLFKEVENKGDTCPLCNQKVHIEIPTIKNINQSLVYIEKSLEGISKERPRLREYIEKLELTKEETQIEVNKYKSILEGLYNQSEAYQKTKDINVRKGKVIGRISLWLESISISSDNTLKEKFDEALQKVKDIEASFNMDGREEKIKSILNRIGFQMTEWSEKLNLEHKGDPVRFDLSNLTIVIDKQDYPITLNRMGSGENWVGYHLIIHLALHKFFLENNRPVPNFLFLDQPTQVYYPKDMDDDIQGSIENLKDEDKLAVERMFELIFTVVNELNPGLQVIITDHADLNNEQFQKSIVEKWRGGNALIPSDW